MLLFASHRENNKLRGIPDDFLNKSPNYLCPCKKETHHLVWQAITLALVHHTNHSILPYPQFIALTTAYIRICHCYHCHSSQKLMSLNLELHSFV